MSKEKNGDNKLRNFLYENSIFLVLGSVVALIWANLDASWGHTSYSHFVHFDLHALIGGGHDSTDGHHGGFTVHFLVNDILMALFFAIAAKEVWEAILPGGSLSNLRKAATPLIGTLGGVIGPAAIYLIGALAFGQFRELGDGWAIPCATDIAFSYLIAKLIFGTGHPAISFLLLLAIADDAIGLAILAVFYPMAETQFVWLLLTAVAVGIGLTMKRYDVKSFWWYLMIPGVMSWFSFYMAGIHAALGLVPIIPTLPHALKDTGLFADDEGHSDALNEFEHWWKNPVELILGLFALVNAGVVLSSFGTGTWLVTMGLFLGKPLGITLFTLAAMKFLSLELPSGMNVRHVIVMGCVASLGFTVALFVSTAAFPTPGPIQDSVKMGALLSFLAPITAFGSAILLGIRPVVFGPKKAKSAFGQSKVGATH
ncbi:Na+/H+ antiporter NhaA [Stieleria varia]|uniref:Na(+)/H(+) antiporter NhaA n=1 Tax=Stieleria varia TaxID=2528005 RepID=A0A5C6AVN0_9BACT|nr:Na+/H+ antiporter NhaA [Stieleria varia]TWU02184.1 Na(+)/H(+) antiporter NhaA [Stieleria varia]